MSLPQSIDAEIGVLGALLVEEEIVGETLQLLNKNYFLVPAHQTIFEVITSLYDNNKPLSPVSVQEELKKKGDMEKVGGGQYLITLMESVPSVANVEYYANVVRDKAIRRQIIAISDEFSLMAKVEQTETETLLDKLEQKVFEINQNQIGKDPDHIYKLMLEFFTEIESKRVSGGLSSGFSDLDNMTSGFQPSTLNILAARPSMGKTSFALNIAESAGVKQNRGVLIFSLEMSKDQIAQNMVCCRSRISPHDLKKNDLTPYYSDLTTAASDFSNAPIFVDDTPGLTARELRAKARRFKMKHDIQLILLDYVQLMEGSGGPGNENRQQEISKISRSLKGIARELNIPVIALSQLNRSVDARDDHRPRMSDLRESGALEQDADIILFLYRDDYYNKESTEPGVTEVIVAKNRTGPTGAVKLRFIREYMKFTGLTYQNVP